MTRNEKLEYAEEFMRHIMAHAIEGGSFRHLIYDRLGFGPEAYTPLYLAGGMDFTNACPINLQQEVPPSFVWSGIGVVDDVLDGYVVVRFPGGDSLRPDNSMTKQVRTDHADWKFHDQALVVYLSTASRGDLMALPAGKFYAHWEFASGHEEASHDQ